MAKVKLTLEDHEQFIIELGKHAFDKLEAMNLNRGEPYPTSRPRQVGLGLWAASTLFSGKHAIPDVTEAARAVSQARADGRLPIYEAD